jgi:hypothetical protein
VIWDWLEDPAVKEIAVIACVGFGKTAILEAWATRIVAVEPGDTLFKTGWKAACGKFGRNPHAPRH